MRPGPLDVQAIRRPLHVPRAAAGSSRTTRRARSRRGSCSRCTQSLAPGYENVHRGQSTASQQMTALFEESYDTIAQFIGAPSRASIALYRNTTEAINAVMYSLLTEFRDGDNVVTTMMEHNSNYVPWYAHVPGDPAPARAAGGVPAGAVRPAHRRAGPRSPGVADRRAHQAGLLHRRVELPRHPHPAGRGPGAGRRAAATGSPSGERRSYLLVDAAQLVPGIVRRRAGPRTSTTWRSPSTRCSRRSGSACCTPRSTCSAPSLPFLYGGDMIAEGQVFPGPGRVQRAALEVRRRDAQHPRRDRLRAGAAAAARPGAHARTGPAYFGTARPLARAAVQAAMDRVSGWNQQLTSRALDGLGAHRRADHLRPPRRGPAHLAGRVQPRRPRPGQRGRGPEPGRGRVTGRLPLRDARPSRARADPARQLPPELLPLQHPRRRRPGGGRGGRHRRRPRPRRLVPVPAARA